MKREFFGTDVDQAVSKASETLGIPIEELTYTKLEHSFGEALQEQKIAIIVDYQERENDKALPDTLTGPSDEERAARKEGSTRWATFLVDGIFKRMNLESTTTSHQEGENIILSVEVDRDKLDLRRGENRELRGAIQHIINRSLTMAGEEGRRFIVDIGNTLKERSSAIKELALDLGKKVGSLGKEIHIHLMDSQDRRLLHTAVMEEKNISTQGRGEKQFRVLSLEPKSEKLSGSKNEE